MVEEKWTLSQILFSLLFWWTRALNHIFQRWEWSVVMGWDVCGSDLWSGNPIKVRFRVIRGTTFVPCGEELNFVRNICLIEIRDRRQSITWVGWSSCTNLYLLPWFEPISYIYNVIRLKGRSMASSDNTSRSRLNGRMDDEVSSEIDGLGPAVQRITPADRDRMSRRFLGSNATPDRSKSAIQPMMSMGKIGSRMGSVNHTTASLSRDFRFQSSTVAKPESTPISCTCLCWVLTCPVSWGREIWDWWRISSEQFGIWGYVGSVGGSERLLHRDFSGWNGSWGKC